MSRTARLTNPPRAFCASWAQTSPSLTTTPTARTSTPIAAARIRKKFSASSRKAARMSASPTMATPIASCSAMKTANWSMAMRFWRSRRSIYCNRTNLRDNTLVATVMSNFGLDETLTAHGGKVIRTKVGDRYVHRRNDGAKSEPRRRTERPHDFSRLHHHRRRHHQRAANFADHESNREAAERAEALPEKISAGAAEFDG